LPGTNTLAITKISKLRTNKFYNIVPRCIVKPKKMYRAEQNLYRFRANFSDCDNFGISYAEKSPLKYESQTRNYFIKLFYIIITGKNESANVPSISND
jgi:hypothetical protein